MPRLAAPTRRSSLPLSVIAIGVEPVGPAALSAFAAPPVAPVPLRRSADVQSSAAGGTRPPEAWLISRPRLLAARLIVLPGAVNVAEAIDAETASHERGAAGAPAATTGAIDATATAPLVTWKPMSGVPICRSCTDR